MHLDVIDCFISGIQSKFEMSFRKANAQLRGGPWGLAPSLFLNKVKVPCSWRILKLWILRVLNRPVYNLIMLESNEILTISVRFLLFLNPKNMFSKYIPFRNFFSLSIFVD